MANLTDIEGIDQAWAARLKAAGVRTVEGLLAKGATTAGRAELAEKSGISGSLILEWVNHADLYRIRGIGSEYSDLLEEAGVDSVPELAQRNAENLLAKLTEVNLAKKLVRRLPVLSQIKNWIAQAQQLPRVVTH